MIRKGSQPVPIESTDAECMRLREENARLRQLLAEHNIPIPPTEPAMQPCVKPIEVVSLGREAGTGQKENRSISEPFPRERRCLRATMGKPRWPLGIYTGSPERLESD